MQGAVEQFGFAVPVCERFRGCQKGALREGKVAVYQLPSFFHPEPAPPFQYCVCLDFELDQLEAEAERAAAPRWGFPSHCFVGLE